LVVGVIIAAVIVLAFMILIALYAVVRRKRAVRREPVCKPLPSNMEKMCVEQAIWEIMKVAVAHYKVSSAGSSCGASGKPSPAWNMTLRNQMNVYKRQRTTRRHRREAYSVGTYDHVSCYIISMYCNENSI
jgi:hypothetical protein